MYNKGMTKAIAKRMSTEQREEIFADVYARTNSPLKATLAAYPNHADNPAYAAVKGQRELKKKDIQTKIQKKLETMHKKALKSIDELIVSDNDEIRFKSSKFVIEHLRGKPVARHVGLNATASLEDVLSALQ